MSNRGTPLSADVIQTIESFIQEKQISKSQMALLIGVPRTTLSDIMRGGNTSRRNVEKVMQFFRTGQQPKMDISIPLPSVRGDEKPGLNTSELQALFIRFQISADILLPVMTMLANGDIGSRVAFHRRFGAEFQNLYLLTRALSSESMLAVVRGECGKNILP